MLVNSGRVICGTRGREGWPKILPGYYRQAEFKEVVEWVVKYWYWSGKERKQLSKIAKVSVGVEANRRKESIKEGRPQRLIE